MSEQYLHGTLHELMAAEIIMIEGEAVYSVFLCKLCLPDEGFAGGV